jgi:hypothetical protein
MLKFEILKVNMKRLILFVFLLGSLQMQAQKQNYAFTLLAGPSIAWYKPATNAVVNGAPSDKNISGSGFNVVLRYEYQRATYIGFGAQAAFERTTAGIYRNYDINGVNQSFKDSLFAHYISLNTINIPVFLKIRLFNGRYNTSYTYFHLGPGIQILVGAARKVQVNNFGYKTQFPDQTDHPDFTNNLVPYFRAAMGRLILTRKYTFNIEFAYNAGIGSWKFNRYNPDLSIPGTESFRRSSLILDLGIRLKNYRQPGCHEF